MKISLFVVLFTFAGIASGLAATTKRATPARKNTSSSKATGTRTAAASSRKRGRSVAHAAPRRVTQQTPSTDRYREIQQALVSKGYLKSEPTGLWDNQSSEALRQFQSEQQLSPTGKISAATLIALGLGPGAQSASAAPASSAPASSPQQPE